jgi:hypothetical protein
MILPISIKCDFTSFFLLCGGKTFAFTVTNVNNTDKNITDGKTDSRKIKKPFEQGSL